MSSILSQSLTDVCRAVLDFIQHDLMNQPGDLYLASDDDLLTGGCVDSLGVMRLIAFLEETYRISIPTEEVTVENFVNGSAIAAYVLRQQQSAQSGN